MVFTRIIYVDDEKSARTNFHYDTRDFDCISSVQYFDTANEAIQHAKSNPIDVAFLDIDLGEMNGIELVSILKEQNKDMEAVFITGHDNYALEAYRSGARAYLVKPYTVAELDEVFVFLTKLFKVVEPEDFTNENLQGRVEIRTFGRFDLYIDGLPIVFKTTKSKELFAFLIDNKGASVTATEIFTNLWEDKPYTKSTSSYVRKAVAALKEKLEELNLSCLVNFNRNAININMNYFKNGFADCDYYSIMQEQRTHIREYNGYYMMQYAWAEESINIIETKIKYLNQTR
ncbi:MAG: response regulator [Clostridia bacterium]